MVLWHSCDEYSATKNIEMFICNDNTIAIRLSDTSGNQMAKSCLKAEWSIIQVTIWLQDKKSGN